MAGTAVTGVGLPWDDEKRKGGMKAKELFEQHYKDAEDKGDAASTVFVLIIREFKTLIEVRRANSSIAYCAILEELESKWKAFARLTNGNIREEGFYDLLHRLYPEVHGIYAFYKHNNKQLPRYKIGSQFYF